MIGCLSLATMAGQFGGLILNGDADITAVSINTRELRPGQTFVAIAGPNFDGHSFAKEAGALGATSVVVEKAQRNLNTPQWVVEDSVKALGLIGKTCRKSFKSPVIGITGSSGKTSVKEMLASILRQRGEVLSTRGNLNNHLGVPLMLAELGPQHAFAVLEMGASAEGEIAYLSDLVRPDVALVNNVGQAHLEGFGSVQGIIRGKGEIYRSLSDAGRAVVNLDSTGATQFLRQISSHNSAQILTFSATGKTNADVRVTDVRLHHRGADYRLLTPLGETEVRQSVLGFNNVSNGAAAATCALAVGIRLEEISAGLNQVSQVSGRLFRREGIAGARVLDDAYNANPDSMAGAIEVLANFNGTRILVMGAMAELGESAEQYHREMGDAAKRAGIECLLCVGNATRPAAEAFGSRAIWVATNDEAVNRCLTLMGPQTTLLIKGSRSARLDEVVDRITDLEGQHAVLAN